MILPKVRVKHCMVCHTIRQYGSEPTSDLLGVRHLQFYPPETVFPSSLERLDLFTRFYLDSVRAVVLSARA